MHVHDKQSKEQQLEKNKNKTKNTQWIRHRLRNIYFMVTNAYVGMNLLSHILDQGEYQDTPEQLRWQAMSFSVSWRVS